MEWQWSSPTRIFFGRSCLTPNSGYLNLGRKAFIVTGQGGSARRNGALQDVVRALRSLGIEFFVYDQVKSNPALADMRAAASIARLQTADFVVGIGGGSSLDAAKAIAVLAVSEVDDIELFNGHFAGALPVAALPTTAGTGSEVTPYSILTYPAINTKKSIFSPLLFPRVAYLDPAYTYALPHEVTIDTAVDAFAHGFESLLSVRSSPLSALHSREALYLLGRLLTKMSRSGSDPDQEERSQMLYASMLAGLAISHTGTSIPHALGYSFTYFKGIPHGRATGYVLGPYARFLDKREKARVQEALHLAGFSTMADFFCTINKLTGPPPPLTPEENAAFLEICSRAKNLANSIASPAPCELEYILNQVQSESH